MREFKQIVRQITCLSSSICPNMRPSGSEILSVLCIFLFIVEVRNFLDSDECDAIIQLAKEKGMKQAAPTIKRINLPEKDSHQYFDMWDKDLDGFLTKEEVVITFVWPVAKVHLKTLSTKFSNSCCYSTMYQIFSFRYRFKA